ncbi:MAG: hypothetical protein JWO82_4363, partial [Akkermansiaceae bacterium]|nr:hypothetical protein [Akkermansiaceae bacterium]
FLHLIFAVIGIVAAVWCIYLIASLSRNLSDPEMGEVDQRIRGDMLIIGLVALSTLLNGVPMAVAGVLLIRRKPRGLLWSNVYAAMSLSTKIALPFLWLMAPSNWVSNSPLQGFFDLAPLAIYPVITLIFLNRPAIREWAAASATIVSPA